MTADECRALAAHLEDLGVRSLNTALDLRARADALEAIEMRQHRPSRDAVFSDVSTLLPCVGFKYHKWTSTAR